MKSKKVETIKAESGMVVYRQEVGLGGGMGDVDGREQRGSQVGESRQLMHSMMPGINTTSTHWNRHRIKYCAKRVSFRYSHHTQKELTM